MIKLLLAIAAYAVFATVLTIIERIQDSRRPPEDLPAPEEPAGPLDRSGPAPEWDPEPEAVGEPDRDRTLTNA